MHIKKIGIILSSVGVIGMLTYMFGVPDIVAITGGILWSLGLLINLRNM